MSHFYRSNDNRGIWLSILMIVFGLILILWPGHVMGTAMTILAIGLLLAGGIMIFSWYRGRDRGESVLTLTEGILFAAGGLIVLLGRRFIISIVPWIVGIFVLINGALNLAQAMDQRRSNYNHWMGSLVMAILTVALGLLIIFNPFSTMEILVVAIGAVMLYNGISNLIIEAGYRRM